MSDDDLAILARYRAVALEKPRVEVDQAILRAAHHRAVTRPGGYAAVAIAASVLVVIAVGIWRPFAGEQRHAAVLPDTRAGLADGREASPQAPFEVNWTAKQREAPGFTDGRADDALTAAM